ncbi:hypothetical protein BD779DRAFT_1685642 [Infundibulicybe gibba]|nr:hypothetical protein BD779DRAFT_1685642 [Infundibulicybe gibba]
MKAWGQSWDNTQWKQYMTNTIEWDENLFKAAPVILPHMLTPDAPPLAEINTNSTTNLGGTDLPGAFNGDGMDNLLGMLHG